MTSGWYDPRRFVMDDLRDSSGRASRLYALAAWGVWVGFIVILTIVTGAKSAKGLNSVVPDYRIAAQAWVHGEAIYDLHDKNGFVYLPSSAVLTVPLALMPEAAHEFAFRWISLIVLAWAVQRLAAALWPRRAGDAFLVMTLCVIPAAAGPARAGQMNLLLGAFMALAAADAMKQRWNWAALWLGLGVALKPQAIVLAALMTALWPQLWLRGVLALLAAAVLPFLCQWPAYVVEQYRLCIAKLHATGNPSQQGIRFNDLSGLMGAMGIVVSEKVRWGVRAVAALATVLLCGLARRRFDAVTALLMTLAFAAAYLMLFNPRTEGGSYVVAAVPVGVFVVSECLRKKPWMVAGLIVIVVLWGVSYDVSNGLWTLAHKVGMPTAAKFREGWGPYWLSPLLGVAFLVYLLGRMAGRAANVGMGAGGTETTGRGGR